MVKIEVLLTNYYESNILEDVCHQPDSTHSQLTGICSSVTIIPLLVCDVIIYIIRNICSPLSCVSLKLFKLPRDADLPHER